MHNYNWTVLRFDGKCLKETKIVALLASRVRPDWLLKSTFDPKTIKHEGF